jgi:hypothetical protein
MFLLCPDCHGNTFNFHVPPPQTPKPQQLLYVLCARCGKLWMLKPVKTIRGLLVEVELTPMVETVDQQALKQDGA